MASPTARGRALLLCAAGGGLLAALAVCSLLTGKYPLTLGGVLAGEPQQLRVFWTLRLPRTAAGVVGGFCLGTAGFVYQTVFRNPLASPDVIGVSSGASAGAAAGILFCSGAGAVTLCAFAGALGAAAAVLALSRLDRTGRSGSIVLAGIAIHALAQTALMVLKLTADPERQLASIEYWIMGSLGGISRSGLGGNLLVCLACLGMLFPLHRQILILSVEESEARTLGVHVGRLRLLVILTATLAVSSVVSLTGLVSFVGLLAPHGARLLTGRSGRAAMALSGLLGGILLCGADLLARSAPAELPVSIFTSLLGAPLLLCLIGKEQGRI